VDDRDISFGRKLHDAYLMGMPHIAIVGREFDTAKVEVEYRDSHEKKFYSIEELGGILQKS
jgi:prolyl-tRNA synthetase